MFPILAIEQFYKNHLEYHYDPGARRDMGSICAQWLLSFNDDNPFQQALKALATQNQPDDDKRLYFAMAMALCDESPITEQVIRRYKAHLDAYSWEVGSRVSEMASYYNREYEVDVIKIFSLLPKDLYEVARKAYRVDSDDLRDCAVACDNLRVFTNSLDEDPVRSRYQAFFALAGFPIDLSAKVHQALIRTQEDEDDLTFYRLLRVRHQLVVNYTNGIYWLRADASGRATLKPDQAPWLSAPSLHDTLAVHHEPGFCEQIARSPVRYIKSFFAPMGQSTPSPVLIEHAGEVTDQFLKAGVQPNQILTQGLFEWGVQKAPVSLRQALEKLETLEANDLAIFDATYRAYLQNFSAEDIIARCQSPKSLALAYRITGDKALLQSANDTARTLIMGQDLGL